MDFSFLLIIPLAAFISAVTVFVMAVVPRWQAHRNFPVSFWISFVFSALILKPWHGIALREAGFLLLGLGLIFGWVAAGCVIGAVPSLLIIKVVRAMRGR